ncbi:isochorismate synthase [Gryllotalpicola sp.]|uniref:isochorismate synthase n=1 Tax=Gryllotalpicola sp. TaxID=1932787 RepID=UPI00260E9621|nr:isochorismate synthase [Gryllotalpicola sp.]
MAGVETLLGYASATHPLVWLRGGAGIVGVGEALRLTFSGPDRVRDAAAAWRSIAAAATVEDPFGLPGSGLVAFGAFAFADRSSKESVLIVPSVVIGRRRDRTWVTRIEAIDTARPSTAGETRDGDRGGGELPIAPSRLGTEYRLAMLPGLQTSAGYRAAVESAVSRIAAGEVDKVVLARDLHAHAPAGADLRRALARLQSGYPDTWTFAVDGLLGASPETLIEATGRSFNSVVLAGTASRGADAAADRAAAAELVASAKDRAEHGFAADSVLEALRPHAATLDVSAPETLRLPNLWHLATTISGRLADGASTLDLVAALHPTAAVAGTPTDAALRLIAELEPFDRGRYGGPVGWIGADGSGEWALALRCAQVEESGDLTAYAGGGIVAGSDPVLELAETTMKFRPIVEAFG